MVYVFIYLEKKHAKITNLKTAFIYLFIFSLFRAYRIGQRRDVKVYRMISSGTIEENMYLRQVYKQVSIYFQYIFAMKFCSFVTRTFNNKNILFIV